jgi:hypothetical protein
VLKVQHNSRSVLFKSSWLGQFAATRVRLSICSDGLRPAGRGLYHPANRSYSWYVCTFVRCIVITPPNADTSSLFRPTAALLLTSGAHVNVSGFARGALNAGLFGLIAMAVFASWRNDTSSSFDYGEIVSDFDLASLRAASRFLVRTIRGLLGGDTS